MKFAGDQLLASAALADHQHGARHRCDPHDRFLELRQGRARADERGFEPEPVPQQGDLGGQPAPLDRVLDFLRHTLHRLGLIDEAVRAEANRLRAAVIVARSGIHDDRHAQSQPLDRAQHLEPVHPRHFEIENDAIHRITRQAFECRAAAFCDECFVAAQALEVVGVLLGHGRDVIDDEHYRHGIPRLKPGPGETLSLRTMQCRAHPSGREQQHGIWI